MVLTVNNCKRLSLSDALKLQGFLLDVYRFLPFSGRPPRISFTYRSARISLVIDRKDNTQGFFCIPQSRKADTALFSHLPFNNSRCARARYSFQKHIFRSFYIFSSGSLPFTQVVLIDVVSAEGGTFT